MFELFETGIAKYNSFRTDTTVIHKKQTLLRNPKDKGNNLEKTGECAMKCNGSDNKYAGKHIYS